MTDRVGSTSEDSDNIVDGHVPSTSNNQLPIAQIFGVLGNILAAESDQAKRHLILGYFHHLIVDLAYEYNHRLGAAHGVDTFQTRGPGAPPGQSSSNIASSKITASNITASDLAAPKLTSSNLAGLRPDLPSQTATPKPKRSGNGQGGIAPPSQPTNLVNANAKGIIAATEEVTASQEPEAAGK